MQNPKDFVRFISDSGIIPREKVNLLNKEMWGGKCILSIFSNHLLILKQLLLLKSEEFLCVYLK